MNLTIPVVGARDVVEIDGGPEARGFFLPTGSFNQPEPMHQHARDVRLTMQRADMVKEIRGRDQRWDVDVRDWPVEETLKERAVKDLHYNGKCAEINRVLSRIAQLEEAFALQQARVQNGPELEAVYRAVLPSTSLAR